MDGRCNDCKPAVQVDILLLELNTLKEKVNRLETNTAVNEEQTKMIFKILTEIKESIADINTTIQGIKEKPATRWESLVTTIITVAVSIAATFFITNQ